MKLITHEDIKGLGISVEKCYSWVSEIIKNKKDTILPAKISMKPMEGVFCNVMPSIIKNNGELWGGVKLVTRYPQRIPSLDSKILLFHAQTGEFKAVMDANWITAMRTGAVAAHSIKLLAKENFSEIGIIGLGNTARAAILTLSELIDSKKINIKLLKYKGQEMDFAKRFEDKKNITFSFVDIPEEVVKNSDVVISAATYLPNDLCANDCFKEGVLVVPIHTLGFTNCDLFFDKVFADDRGHVCHFKNFEKFRYFSEVSDVVNGISMGRENNKERILVYNIGVSVHDINFAVHIYRMLEKNNNLQNLDFYAPEEKFWI